jgi:hypothetical protein
VRCISLLLFGDRGVMSSGKKVPEKTAIVVIMNASRLKFNNGLA